MAHTAAPKVTRNRARAITLLLAALIIVGALIHWQEDIARLLDAGGPLFRIGLALVIPYLVFFVFLTRRAVRAWLDDDATLRAQVRTLQVLRWTGVGLAIVIGIGMAQPIFASEWNPYWIDAVQQGRTENLPLAVSMVVNAVMVSVQVGGATAFLLLWILGIIEVVLCALTLSTPTPSWDVRKEAPVPGDIVVNVAGALIHAALSQISPEWTADNESESDRLQAVTILAQSVGTFHLTCGLIIFAAWIVWSLLTVVVEVVTW